MHFRRRIAENLGQLDPKATEGEFFVDSLSMLFDGVDERVSVAHSASLNFERTDAFSISVWFKRTGATSFDTLISKMINGGTYRGYEIILTDTNIIWFALITDLTGGKLLRRASTPTFLTGVWNHLVMTYDGSSLAAGMKVYLNGATLASTVTHDTLDSTIQNTVPCVIGMRQTVFGFEGYLDEVAIWNTELSLADVVDIYHSGVPRDLLIYGPTANLVSWWRMGENIVAFPTIPDVKAANAGTATNMESGDVTSVVPPL